MLRQLRTAIRAVVLLTVLVGVAYPLAVTAVGQVAFNDKANGSMVKAGDQVIGSTLIGQNFTDPKYFHPRPSAAGDGYDPTSSGATNLGPSNTDLLASVEAAAIAYRSDNGLAADAKVPGDAVTSSASGLDPEISVANARLQAQRVATARNVPLATVTKALGDSTRGRSLGFLGDEGVNVLELNRTLDRLG